MALSKPDTVIFDLDGVVVGHNNPKLISRLERYDSFIHMIKQLFRFRASSKYPQDMDLSINVESNPLIHRIVHSIRRSRGQKATDIVHVNDGFQSIVEYLREYKIQIGLVSNAHGKLYGYEVLDDFNIQDCFDSIIFRDNVKRGKPYPEGILRCLDKLNDPKHIWFIGDQSKDIKAVMRARKYLNEDQSITPFSFGGAYCSAYYMIHKLSADPDSDISQKYALLNFNHLMKRLKKSLELKTET